MTLTHLRGGLEHLVGSRNDLGIDLVGALCGNQTDHFFDDVDVALFGGTLHQGAATFFPGGCQSVLHHSPEWA